MTHSKSAEKRVRINKRNRLRNRFYKSSSRTLIKKFSKELEIYKNSKNPENRKRVQKILSSIYSLIDKATKNKIVHRNTAAKKKASLVNYLKQL